MNVINIDRNILWKQVGGLASMLAAIIFCWMAYEFYQPQILRNLGFLELATWLGVIQGILAAGVEPVVGSLSDRIMRVVGSRLPIIAVGVTLAGAIFVIVSGLLEPNLPEGLRWLVPGLMTLWVIAMIVFRGPAIATFPLGKLVTKLGDRSGMVLGLSAVAIGIALTLLRQTIFGQNIIFELVHILITGIAFGLVFISMIPFALSMLSNGNAGLATGLYFGGGGLATALLNGIAQYFGGQLDRVEARTAVMLALVALPITIGCIATKRYDRVHISE